MQSEKEFLSGYSIEKYERPSVTADIVALMIHSTQSDNYRLNSENKLSVLLIKRGEHPFKDHWALPGGFLVPGETIEECALRETKEETNVIPVSIMPIGVFSKPGRDPRGWIISNAYTSIISEESVNQKGQDDAKDAQWFDVEFEQNEGGEYRLRLSYGDIELNALLTEKEEKLGRTSAFTILAMNGQSPSTDFKNSRLQRGASSSGFSSSTIRTSQTLLPLQCVSKPQHS